MARRVQSVRVCMAAGQADLIRRQVSPTEKSDLIPFGDTRLGGPRRPFSRPSQRRQARGPLAFDFVIEIGNLNSTRRPMQVRLRRPAPRKSAQTNGASQKKHCARTCVTVRAGSERPSRRVAGDAKSNSQWSLGRSHRIERRNGRPGESNSLFSLCD